MYWHFMSRIFCCLLTIPETLLRKSISDYQVVSYSLLHYLQIQNCQTRVQIISRSTLGASQVLSNSISISDSGSLDLSRHYNCNIPPPPMKLFGVSQNILRHSRTNPNIPKHTQPCQTILYHTIPNHTKLNP